jgi:hypothetical protein
MKVRFDFYTSPLISATFLVYAWNVDGFYPVPATGEKENALRKVVQVRGHTSASFIVPYFSRKAWQGLTSDVSVPPSLLFCQRLIGPNSIGDNAGTVVVLVSVAAGDDFQFRAIRSPISQTLPPQGKRKKGSVAQSLNKMFESGPWDIIGGGDTDTIPLYDLFENISSVEDISQRFSERSPDVANIGLQLPNTYSVKDHDTFDFIRTSFQFMRGSYRLKNPISGVTAVQYMYMPSTITSGTSTFVGPSGNGLIAIDPATTSLREMEVPYYSEYNWVMNENLSTTYLIEPESPHFDVSTTKLFIAGGLDYQLAFMLPPRNLYYYSVTG